MTVLPRRGRISGRQRAVLAAAGLAAVLITSAMFFSLHALTADGADYDCGPAAFALVAGPDRQTADAADCSRAAAQRLTTVVGLATLAVVAGLAGSWLLDVPTRRSSPGSAGIDGGDAPTVMTAKRGAGTPGDYAPRTNGRV